MYKLNFYVPETHLQAVKQALFDAGAGRYEGYDQCCWQVRGTGQFRPLASSQPFIGQFERLETLVEYKVEMICDDTLIKAVVQALINAHPYEEPAYEVYKIVSLAEL